MHMISTYWPAFYEVHNNLYHAIGEPLWVCVFEDHHDDGCCGALIRKVVDRVIFQHKFLYNLVIYSVIAYSATSSYLLFLLNRRIPQ